MKQTKSCVPAVISSSMTFRLGNKELGDVVDFDKRSDLERQRKLLEDQGGVNGKSSQDCTTQYSGIEAMTTAD